MEAWSEAEPGFTNYTASRLVRDLHAVPRYDWHVSPRNAHVPPRDATASVALFRIVEL